MQDGSDKIEDERASLGRARKILERSHARPLEQKARDRCDATREERPEIVRISELPEKVVHDETSPSILPGHTTTPGSRKKRRTSLPKERRPQSSIADMSIDRWLPDISSLPVCTKEDRSNIVWLHGLPKNTTVGQIRRFFSGLDVKRVVILLSNPTLFPQLDGDHSLPHKQHVVERCEASTRVLVQFESAPIAELAANRSGEVLTVGSSSSDGMPHQDHNLGALIAVTQIRKPVASAVKHVAVDGQIGCVLEHTLHSVEEQLDPLVRRILWAAVARDLSLEGKDDQNKTDLYPLGRKDEPMIVLEQNDDISRLERRRQFLQEDYDRLVYNAPFPTALKVLNDPELEACDPVVRLSTRAGKVLQNELEFCTVRLQQARLWNRLRMSKVHPETSPVANVNL